MTCSDKLKGFKQKI